MSDLEKNLQLVQKKDGYITTKEVVDNGLNKIISTGYSLLV